MAGPSDPVPLLLAHADAMRRLARALVHDEHLSEDVAQEAARVVLTKSVPADRPRWGWLAAVVRNTARNLRRAERRRRVREAGAAAAAREAGGDAADPAGQVARVEAQRRVVEAVLALEEPYRLVVVRRFFESQSVDEIAARMETPRETVRTRLRRALERLRAALDDAPAGRDWRLALLPPLAPAFAAPRGPRHVPTLVGAIAMKKVVTALAALLFVVLGWTAWRVTALSAEVERLSLRPEPAPPREAATLGATAPAPAAGTAPTLAVPRPASDLTERRLAALETNLAELSAKWGEMAAAQKDLAAQVDDLWVVAMRFGETAVISTTRVAISAQAQFQQGAKADQDGDGTGEYGGFVEMSAGGPGRIASGSVLSPPVLAAAFRTLTAGGELVRGGYVYRIFLPDARGAGVGEPQGGFARGSVDANLAETTWCLYAWPVAYGKTGMRTFFTNQGGDVTATEVPTYSGPGNGPPADAAFVERGTIVGRVAIGAQGSDGHFWKQVN